MRKRILTIATLLALTLIAAGPTLASIDSPALGEPATIYGADGGEAATMTVTEVQDPFEDLTDFSEQPEDGRYVLITVEIENIGERPFEFSPYDVFLRDTLGRTWGSTYVPRSEESEAAATELEDRNMNTGETHSGVLGFGVPADAELSDVMYSSNANDVSVLYSIADLGGGAPATDGDETEATPDEEATPEA